MSRGYGLALLAVLGALLVSTCTAYSSEYMVVHSVKNCLPLQQTPAARIALTEGTAYSVSVDGDAVASGAPGSEYEGVFCFYYDHARPEHPELIFLEKGEILDFVASATDFYAFLVEESGKVIWDNAGTMTLTFGTRGQRRAREELVLDGIFNCVGLEDYAAAKKYLVAGQPYTATVVGTASTGPDPDAMFDGVFLFYKEIHAPVLPVMKMLAIGDEIGLVPHSAGWVFGCLVDEGFATMVDNSGDMTVEFAEFAPVEEGTWGAIKALYR